MTTNSLRAIGHVRSAVTAQTDHQWGAVTSRIELLPEYRAGLAGLDQFSHLLVITYLHEASYDPVKHLTRRPRGLESMPRVGIFAQRAKDRPNPIGVTAVSLLSVTSDSVVVQASMPSMARQSWPSNLTTRPTTESTTPSFPNGFHG